MIKFNKLTGQAKLLNPLKNFELDSQPIEYREDPLTGYTSFIRPGRKEWGFMFKTDEKLLKELIEGSRGGCFFCPEKVDTSTPKFPASFLPQGRIKLGEVTLFPNLFAHKEWSAIAVLSKSHYLKLGEFTPELLFNGLKASLSYIDRAYRLEGARYAELGFNYLFPAGASIVHPHLQVLASGMPYYLIKQLMEYGRKYYEENSVNFWQELIKTEKSLGERYLGCLGNTEWYVPFAPIREEEVLGVVRNKSNFMEFDEADLKNLSLGLSTVLKYYEDAGYSAFNFAFYSGPLGEKLDYLWAGLRIVVRPGVQPNYVNDMWFPNVLHLDGYIIEFPEETAKSLMG